MTNQTMIENIQTMIREYDKATGANGEAYMMENLGDFADLGKSKAELVRAGVIDQKHFPFYGSAAFILYYLGKYNVRRFESVYGMLESFDAATGSTFAESTLKNPEEWVDKKDEYPFYAAAAELLMDAHIEVARRIAEGRKSGRKVDFRGFGSIEVFESECKRLGYTVEKIPVTFKGERCFVLKDEPKGCTGCASWTVFTEDETAILLEGVEFKASDDRDVNFTGKLAAYGFRFEK